MPERLSIPTELQFLLEKRTPAERRKAPRRKKAVTPAVERRSDADRRKTRERRRKA